MDKSKKYFISYAHKDADLVLPKIKAYKAEGYDVWFDEGIEAGSDWAESIGKHLEEANTLIYFKSKHSDNSDNCKRELAFAKEHGIEIITVPVKRKNAFVLAVALVAIILVIVFALLLTDVPNVIGQKIRVARLALEDAGLGCGVSYNYSNDLELGYVIAQNKNGKSIKGSSVVVTQSLGKEDNLTTVPDTVGNQVSKGIAMLVDAGILKFTINSDKLDNNDFGIITYQSAPAGYKISCDSYVDLLVATEDEKIVVKYKEREITVYNDIPAVIDFSNELEKLIAEVYPNASVISVDEVGKDVNIENKVFDGPVLVTGREGKIIFNNCIFNDDIINVTDNEGVGVFLLPTCSFNGKYMISSHIKESIKESYISKVITFVPIEIECGDCAGSAVYVGDINNASIIFNDVEYTTDDITTHIIEDGDTITFEPYAGQDINVLYVGQWWENGEKVFIVGGEWADE